MMVFQDSRGRPDIVITDAVLEHFAHSRQIGRQLSETGGQLFAIFSTKQILLARVTGPRKTCLFRRFSFLPSRRQEIKEIRLLFKDGYHYVGDWHTHPEPIPTPSRDDIQSMSECYKQSRHELRGFLLIIVGQAMLPDCLWIGIIDEKSVRRLV